MPPTVKAPTTAATVINLVSKPTTIGPTAGIIADSATAPTITNAPAIIAKIPDTICHTAVLISIIFVAGVPMIAY